MTTIFNENSSKSRRRVLRKDSSLPETIMWSKLRNRQLAGYKFKRQFSIDHYIVDFYCPAAQLVIEIDGDSHFTAEGQLYDEQRTAYFTSLGLQIVRFTNTEVRQNLSGVLEKLRTIILTSPQPSPS